MHFMFDTHHLFCHNPRQAPRGMRMAFMPQEIHFFELGLPCATQDPRQYHTEFKVKNTDFEKVPKIISSIMEYLHNDAGVDKQLPLKAQLRALGDSSVTIGITVSIESLCLAQQSLEAGS